MIALLLGLIMLLPRETIYSGYLSFAPLEQVVINRGWQDVDSRFDILLATPNCNDLAKWAWVISKDGVMSGLVVDCSKLEHRKKMIKDLIVADCNLPKEVHKYVWIVMR